MDYNMFQLFDKDGTFIGTIEESGDPGCGGWIVLIMLGLVFVVVLLALLKTVWWLLLVQALAAALIAYGLSRLLKKQITNLTTMSNICGIVCFVGVMASSYFLYLDYFTVKDLQETLITVAVWIWTIVFAYVIASFAAWLVRKDFWASNA